MSDRYETTVTVHAWQYTGAGVIPDGAREAFEFCRIEVRHRTVPYHMHQAVRDIVAGVGCEPPEEGTMIDVLLWFDGQVGHQECRAGGWIVQDDEHGFIEAVPDETFRADYRMRREDGGP